MERIHLKLADGDDAYIDVDDGQLDAELQNFLNQQGRFLQAWVEVHAVGGEVKYVRYDQIVQMYAFK